MNVKDLDQKPAPALRLKLRLMRYTLKVEYVPGAQDHTADALSRTPTKIPSSLNMMLIENLKANASILPCEDLITEEIKAVQQQDPVCQQVLQVITKGWPAYKTDANKSLHP